MQSLQYHNYFAGDCFFFQTPLLPCHVRASVRMLCPEKETWHLLHLRVSGAFVGATAPRQKLTFPPLVYIYPSALRESCLLLQDAERRRLVRSRQKSVVPAPCLPPNARRRRRIQTWRRWNAAFVVFNHRRVRLRSDRDVMSPVCLTDLSGSTEVFGEH